mgnify:CR=1 FL=1
MKANTLRELRELKSEVKRRRAGAETLEAVNVLDHIAEVYHPLHSDLLAGAHQYYNLPGGRGSGKSTVVRRLQKVFKDRIVVIPQDSY